MEKGAVHGGERKRQEERNNYMNEELKKKKVGRTCCTLRMSLLKRIRILLWTLSKNVH